VDNEEKEDVQVPAGTDNSKRTRKAKAPATAWHGKNVIALANTIRRMGFIKDTALQPVMNILFYNFVEILRSTHDDLIESLISGNLSADMRSNATLRHHMQAMDPKVKTVKQPFIYFQQLVDKNGNGPTKREIRKILSYMMLYTEQTHSSAAIPTVNFSKSVRAVDQAFGTKRANELIEDFKNRRYLSILKIGSGKPLISMRQRSHDLQARSQPE